eukprot:TRINITY_DN10013_c0_g1_i1.p1 TRINITY_DN10013_c0_g1~~TRINITY_DN10013_c0_g1_i1.p1  ORF type:complete len:313 (+),score=30.18 TRINITY_DN10013_c0_g1_i1:63-1001(+)
MLHLPCVVADVYRLDSCLGHGGSGHVYKAVHTEDAQSYAVKVARRKKNSSLSHEAHVLRQLQGLPDFTTLHQFVQNDLYDVLVLDLCGCSVQATFNVSQRRISLQETVLLGIQVLRRLESLHSLGYIHRDVTPANLLNATTDEKDTVYLVDFGLATRFIDRKTNLHKKIEEGRRFIGTPPFASIRAHLGIRQSRRDDLEGLGYVLLYLVKGKLPWSYPHGSSEEVKRRYILQMKQSISVDSLCEGLPPAFRLYVQYCRSLEYEDKPDYDYLRRLLCASLCKDTSTVLCDDIIDESATPTTSAGAAVFGRFSL